MAQTTTSKDTLLKSYQTRLKDDVKSMLENFEGELNCQFLSFPAINLFHL